MKYKLLGNSGLRVSELCLGTMTFGDDWGWGAAAEDSRKQYDVFREAGGNFIDTANLYTNGTSEKLLGEFLGADRGSVVLATKYTNSMAGTDPNAAGNHRKNMMQSVEASLKRLKTDYIDLYWLHIWDFLTPVEEIMRAFDDLVRQGKILYAGISDAPAWRVSQANTLAGLRGWTPFIGLQVEYSLIERTPERDLLPMAEAMGLGVTAWSPLASGILTGKYHGGKKDEGGRLSSPMMGGWPQLDDRKKRVVEAVLAVAEEIGWPPAQVALSWVRQQGPVVIPIIGASKVEQLRDNIASLELTLEEGQLKKLNGASAIEMGFPHDFFAKPMVRTFMYGGLYDQIEKPRR